MLQDLARRVDLVHRNRRAAEHAVARRTTLSHALLDSLNWLVGSDAPRAGVPQVPAAPSDLGREVARSDTRLSEIAAALTATAALIDGHRWPEAAAACGLWIRSTPPPTSRCWLAASIGRRDLLARQQALEAVTVEALRDTALWLVLGLVLLWLGLVAIRRRILQPLSALEAGLTRVADGDLNTQVPVYGSDEIARLGTHFNEMTQVLLGRAEEQGRFTAAGQLLADVAHEVGNPLMAIAAHAESRIGDATVSPGQREEMQQILRQAQRATKLLRGLLRFVRPAQRQVSTLNLNDVVRGALDIVSYRFGVDEITVGASSTRGCRPGRGDAVALEQVLVNLLSNAMDALRAIKPPRRLTVDSWVSEGTVSVRVADNGHGVAPRAAGSLVSSLREHQGAPGYGPRPLRVAPDRPGGGG